MLQSEIATPIYQVITDGTQVLKLSPYQCFDR